MENALYKKAYFQCARRAMLENEEIMKRFATDVVKDKYNDEKLERLNKLLTEMFDNDMYDLLMGAKTAEDFKDMYDYEICVEMKQFAQKLIASGEKI